jgi:hypothetical protein
MADVFARRLNARIDDAFGVGRDGADTPGVDG